MPEWRNWQTRCVQVAVNLSSWGFKSLLRYHLEKPRHLALGFFVSSYLASISLTKARKSAFERFFSVSSMPKLQELAFVSNLNDNATS